MLSLEVFGEIFSGSCSQSRRREPLTFAAPLPRGVVATPEELQIVEVEGEVLATQARALDRWADGSVRWALIDILADVDASRRAWRLERRVGRDIPVTDLRLEITDDGRVSVRTGAADFDIGGAGTFPFNRVVAGGIDHYDANRSGLEIVDCEGHRWKLEIAGTAIEEHGPLRASVRLDATLSNGVATAALVTLHLHFYAGSGAVRFELTLRNPRRAAHRNGYWDLGDPGSIRLREVVFRLATTRHGEVFHSSETGRPLVRADGAFALHQYSSGGANWRSPVHVAAEGITPSVPRGYRLRTSAGEIAADRATPIVALRSAGAQLALAVPHFWQNFPKAIDATADALSFSIFPAGSESSHELQGGEQKTHVFFVCFGEDPVSEVPLDWCRAPTRMRTTSEAYARAGAIPAAGSMSHARAEDYERMVAAALDGDSAFDRKREHIDEYGWRHFGDLYADHENLHFAGPGPVISHYNNQYDAVAAFAIQFMRTGDWRWWELMDDLARHVVDIDIYHTDEDRAAYNGGLFWHTNHYISADTATHRSFPRRSALPGGGPSNEHNYTTGLVLHHYLTGSAASAAAVVGLARWVLAMDDGTRSRFWWIDRGPTGLASSTRSADYHGPGRGAGNSIRALVDAHRLTGEALYLEYAEVLIRRCIHPTDDPAGHDLLDAESRWSYTVFLQVLDGYLTHKEHLGQRDVMWRYALESLLQYARWMAAHEVPYLSRPDRLEFPTETWAAQELRKADVLHAAARYASTADRPALTARRDYFFEYALDTLAQMPSARYTRPLVLLLGNGFRCATGDVAVVDALPAEAGGHRPTRPPRFVPQKVRAARRLAILASIGLALMLLLLWSVL